MEEPTTVLGARIREQRLARGLSLAGLAERVGCAKSYLSSIETGRRSNPPSEGLLRRLEEALGFGEGRLLGLAQWRQTPASVRREVARLQSDRLAGRRLAALLREEGENGLGALDAAYRTGELQKLVARLSPERESDGEPGEGPVSEWLPVEVPVINRVAAGYPTEFTDLGYPARVADEYVRAPDLDDPDAFAARVVGDSMAPDYREGDVVVFSPARAVRSGMDCFARLDPDSETTFKRVYFEGEEPGEERIRLQPLNSTYPPRVLPRERVAGLYAAVSVIRSLV